MSKLEMKGKEAETQFMKKKIIRYLVLGICLIAIVVSGLIVREIKRAGEEELTEPYLESLNRDKTIIVRNYLEEQGIEAEVLWSQLVVQDNNAYLLYEYKPKNEEYARELCQWDGDPEDYDYLGYLKLKRNRASTEVLDYYKVVESKKMYCSEEAARSEGRYGLSGSAGESAEWGWDEAREYAREYIFFMKVYTDEIEDIEFYDDGSLLKATYHVGDKGYIFIILQDVRNVMVRFYDKEHNLIGEWDEADDRRPISDRFQNYINIEKGRVDDWENRDELWLKPE